MTPTEPQTASKALADAPEGLASRADKRLDAMEGVRIVSDDGLEIVFKIDTFDQHHDRSHSEQILRFADTFAQRCNEKQELPSVATLVEIAKRTQYRIAARQAGQLKAQRLRRKLAEGSAAFACVILTYALFQGLDRRLNEQKHLAIVASESIDVASPKTGNLVFALPAGPVQKGMAVAGLRTSAGDEFVIEAPCDCILATTSIKPGESVFKDKPLLRFWQNGSPEFVSLRIPMVQALRLKSGLSASIETINSGASRQFNVVGDAISIQSLPAGANNKSTGDVAVRIYPPYPLDLASGEIVSVRLRTSLLQGVPSAAQAKEGL
jgi:hypothetical protein